MKRMITIMTAVGLILCLSSGTYAQQFRSVGDVLDKGGTKLTKEEVQKLFSGSTTSGTQIGKPNITFKNSSTAGGTVSGEAWNNGVSFTKISGTWSVNDLGQFCQNLTNSQNQKITGCFYYYSTGGRYFSSPTAERSALVYERQLTRP